MTDLHDEIRSRLKRRQGRGRIIGDLLDDDNYSHIGFAGLGVEVDRVQSELDAAPVLAGVYASKDATTAELGAAAAAYLMTERVPVVVHGALRWTRPEYSAPIVDTAGLPWKGAWQALPWHDGKRPLHRGPPVDGVALEALFRDARRVVAGGAAWTRAGWVSSRGVVGDYYCTEDVPDATPADLWTLFKDFPLVDTDAYRRVISALVTAVALPAIRGPIPAYLISAHNPGDGKTLIARIISMVADGVETVVPWHDDEDRTRELLLAALDSPSRVVILDNVRGRLGGSILETILTATSIVGSRKYERAREYTVNKLIIITGNDPRVTPDMARRVVRIQVDRGGALPPADLPDVLELARERRPEWLAAVRAMLQEWDRIPRPIHGCRSYETWAGLVGGVLGTDWTPIDAARVAAEHDPEALEWMPALEAWAARQGASPMGAGEILAATGRGPWEGLLRGGRGAPEAQIGAALGRVAGRRIGAYHIERTEVQVYTQDGYRTRHKYTLTCVDSGNDATTQEDKPF